MAFSNSTLATQTAYGMVFQGQYRGLRNHGLVNMG
jgi:hypothetical protein